MSCAFMHPLFVGVGGVGGFYAERLAQQLPVSVVARGEHGRRIAAEGLSVRTPQGERSWRPARVYTEVAQVEAVHDLIVFATKAHQLDAALCDVLVQRLPEAHVLSLLNGVESEAQLATVWPSARVMAGVARIAAQRTAAGVVEVTAGGGLELAAWAPPGRAATETLHTLFTATGVRSRLRDDARLMLWEKLLWNAAFNGVCALTRQRAGDLLRISAMRSLIVALMQEVIAIAHHEGVALQEALIERNLTMTEQHFADIVPSMLQDALAGRALEHDAIQGVIVRRAAAHGVAVPHHRMLAALLQGLDKSTLGLVLG